MNAPPASSRSSILRIASLSGAVGIVQLLTGLIRMKVFAVILGPSLVGYLGILNNYVQIAGSCLTLGLGSVAIREIGDLSGNARAMHAVARWFFRMGIGLAVLALILNTLAAPLLPEIMNTSVGDLVIAGAGVAALVLSTIIVGVFYGLVRTWAYVVSTCLGAGTGTAAAVALILWLREDGIVWAVVVVPVFTVAAQLLAFLRQETGSSVEIEKTKGASDDGRQSMLRIIQLGLPISALLLLQTGTFIVIRQIVLEHSGEVENGLLHAALALAIMMNSLLISAIDGDYLRRLSSQVGDKQLMASVIRQQIEIVVPLLGLLVAGSVAFSEVIVFVLLSREFLPAALAIQLMFISEFFRGIASIYGKTPFAFGRSWMAAVPELIGAIVLIIAAVMLVPKWGANGAAGAFILSRIVLLLISMLVSDCLTTQRTSGRELVLIIFASIGIAAAFAISDLSSFAGYAIGAGCVVGFMYVMRSLVLGR